MTNRKMVRTIAIVHLPRTSFLNSADSIISCGDLGIPPPFAKRWAANRRLPDEDLVDQLPLIGVLGAGLRVARVGKLQVGRLAAREVPAEAAGDVFEADVGGAQGLVVVLEKRLR